MVRRLLWPLLERSVRKFADDRCLQAAAAISYWALFSIFPLAILAVAVLGLVLRDDSLRDELLQVIVTRIPVSAEGSADLEELLRSVTSNESTLGFLGLLALVWTASGLMGAVRDGLNRAWESDSRPPLRGKLLDVGLVLVVALALLLSLGLSVGLRLAEGEIAEVAPWLTGGFVAFGFLLPVALAFATAAFLYRVVPAAPTALAGVWPGALVAALGFEAVKYGFSFYLDNFSRYNVIYGSIGAVVAFLFFVYLAANILLFGAEVAAAWPRIRHEADEPREDGPSPPLRERLLGFARGLVFRTEERDEVKPPGS